jgi:hypothetical protein
LLCKTTANRDHTRPSQAVPFYEDVGLSDLAGI